MINAKSQILSGIRRSLGRRRLDRGSRLGLQKRLDRHARNVIPARSKKGPNSNAKLFISKAIDVSATIAEIGDIKDVPKSVAAYLARHNLPARVVQSRARRAVSHGQNGQELSPQPSPFGRFRPIRYRSQALTLTRPFKGITAPHRGAYTPPKIRR